MDKKQAVGFLKEKLDEIPRLAKLPYNNVEHPLWRNSIEDVLEEVFGRNSTEYKRFYETRSVVGPLNPQGDYISLLKKRRTVILSIIKKYEILGFEKEPAALAGQPPKVFIAHGGDSPALAKLKSFLEALGVQPLVVEEQASEGRSVGENVDWYSRQADCAIILATKGDVDGKTGGFIPRGNVLMEIGKLQELLKDRIVYLVQAGTKLPTNISEKVRVRFSPQSMDDSFIKIAKELKKFGILKAVKPPKE